jgi:manganese/zinc/iron transport system substrate-binding protein
MAQDDSKLKVVATTTQVADLTHIIGGEHVEVTGLMGGGVDPHLYQFTESDIEAMSNADLVLYNGLHLEGGIGEVIEGISNRTRVHAVGETIERLGYTLPSASDPDVIDPHMWFDPRNWQEIVADVVEVLSEEDPQNEELYAEHGDSYVEQLQLLYDWGVEAMSIVPERQRVLITSHDAFQYFGDAFGWDVRGLQGISTEAEAGVGDIQELVDFVIEREIPAMFVESSVPPNTIEAVQSSAQDRGWDVEIGAELFSDAMGEVGTFEGTYIGMVITNITRVVTAFGYADELPPLPDDVPTPEDFEEEEDSDEQSSR